MNCPGSVTVPGGVSRGGRGCRVQVGTCGYSYTEWVDSGFYPEGTKNREMLALYSRSFSVVELNYTWYQMARAGAVARMVENSPPHLRFAAKLTRTMTHERGDRGYMADQLRRYCEGIAPLKDRLLAVLVQFPPDFDRTVNHRRYLASLLDGLQGMPTAVEFRHASWAVDSVLEEMEHRRVTLVTVDEPALPGLFPSLDAVTNPELFYVRFHGRSLRGWKSGNMQKKFDYDYSAGELQEWQEQWLTKLARCADRGILFFNNHVRAQAPRNGQSLLKILQGGRAGL